MFLKRVARIHLLMETRKGEIQRKREEECFSQERGEKLTCKHCSKEGHDEDHCWKLHEYIDYLLSMTSKVGMMNNLQCH
jgi:hypothetical protein